MAKVPTQAKRSPVSMLPLNEYCPVLSRRVENEARSMRHGPTVVAKGRAGSLSTMSTRASAMCSPLTANTGAGPVLG